MIHAADRQREAAINRRRRRRRRQRGPSVTELLCRAAPNLISDR